MKYKKEISAGGIVYKKIGDKTLWLVTQHSKNKHWSFPKGIIGDIVIHEKMEDAALREVEEEGGIKANIVSEKPVAVKYKYRFKDTLVDKTVHYFLMEYISGDPKNHDWEVSEAKFITQEEVLEIISFKTDREAFTKILELFSLPHSQN